MPLISFTTICTLRFSLHISNICLGEPEGLRKCSKPTFPPKWRFGTGGATGSLAKYLNSNFPPQILFLLHRVVTKYIGNLLKRLFRRLRKEEVWEDSSGETEAAEKKICAPAKLDNHLRHDDTNNEVGDPYRCCGQTKALGALRIWEDFSGERPRKRTVWASVAEDVDILMN